METMFVGAGIVFMAGALIGGGLSAFGVTLPLFSSIKRQTLLFLLGAALLAIGAYPSLTKRNAVTGDSPDLINSEDANQTNAEDATETNLQDTDQNNTVIPPPDPVMEPLEEGVNRQGYDFNNIGVEAANAQDCAELCRTNENCVAMTYVISRRRCWLKKEIPAPRSDPDMISALKKRY